MTILTYLLGAVLGVSLAGALYLGKMEGDPLAARTVKICRALAWLSGPVFILSLFISGALTLWALPPLLLALAAFAFLLSAAKTPEKTPAAKAGAALSLLVIIGSVFWLVYASGGFGRRPEGPDLKLEAVQRARATVLGQALKDAKAGERALIIADQTPDDPRRETALIEAMKEAMAPAIEVIGIERLPTEAYAPRRGQPSRIVAEGVKPKEVDKLIGKYPNSDLVIFMNGLPRRFKRMALWELNPAERPAVALFDGNLRGLKPAFKAGLIVAATAYRPGWTYIPRAPEDPRQAFDQRYCLVTPGNVDELSKRYYWLIR